MKRNLLRKIGIFLILLIIAALAVTAYYASEIRRAKRDTPLVIAAAITRYGAELGLKDLSPERKAILIAIEDPAFFRHHGVDLATPGAGMTTITQGLVKLLYFPEGFKQGIQKIRQTLLAQYALDSLVSKDEQLRLFINICYLGNVNNKEIHGYENAGRVYYKKEFSAISDDQFLALVAMHIGPNDLKPGTRVNAERVQRIRRYLSGEYQPAGLLDVDYCNKRHGTFSEEALMAFLRLITDAQPESK